MVKCLLKNYFLNQGHSLILLLPYAWVTLDNSPNLQKGPDPSSCLAHLSRHSGHCLISLTAIVKHSPPSKAFRMRTPR